MSHLEWKKTTFNDVQTLHLGDRHVGTLQHDLAGAVAVLLENAVGTHPKLTHDCDSLEAGRY